MHGARWEATARSRAKTPTDALTVEELRKDLTDYCSLGDRVVDQARRRILDGKQVPASEKLYSIFEPHTDLIKRGKINKPIEFGHKVFLAESAQGLITQYRVLDGNPSDEDHVKSSLSNHKKTFGSAPDVFATDRGALIAPTIRRPAAKPASPAPGVAVLANNMMKIAELLIRRDSKKNLALARHSFLFLSLPASHGDVSPNPRIPQETRAFSALSLDAAPKSTRADLPETRQTREFLQFRDRN